MKKHLHTKELGYSEYSDSHKNYRIKHSVLIQTETQALEDTIAEELYRVFTQKKL